MSVVRRRAIGAEIVGGGVHFRVWAPSRRKVAVVIEGADHPLEPDSGGCFAGLIPDAGDGALYRFRLDDDPTLYPDPASRFQPEGPHGPSQVIDPHAYRWRARWAGVDPQGVVLYEMHIGTFTPAGTWSAAMEKLPLVADVGINVLEIMPVAEFPGRFGWGYDGVDLWAPTRLYGTPDDFRRFVDAAHDLGLAVILDVVYNHLGPDGNYLARFAPHYFTDRYPNEWGQSLNFDGDGAAGVRQFFAENAACWIDEYRLDGLRLDATQSIIDHSPVHVLREIGDAAHRAAGGRPILLIAENEPQDTRLVREYGMDMMWNDDWHHAAVVALTGRIEAYYTDYRGRPQEFVSMARLGFLYQGQRYQWQKKRRGTPSADLPPRQLVCYIENHDQVANSADGARMHEVTSPALHRAMTALLLLQPQTPMLFQGEEFGSSKPFLYFADHEPKLAEDVARGRREFLEQFPSIAASEVELARPHDPETFARCKLDFAEREKNEPIVALHRDLIRLRRGDPAFAAQRSDRLFGAVLGDAAFVLRWMAGGEGDRLLLVNLGADLQLDPAPEPLLAPPTGRRWQVIWSSEWRAYGGGGTPEVEGEEGWRIPARCAVVMG